MNRIVTTIRTARPARTQGGVEAVATGPAGTVELSAALAGIKPLPAWFFGFEGVMGGAFDLCKAWNGAWMVIAALGAVNMVVGLTVLRRRTKLLKAMLKNGRTRAIAIGLLALRLGVHLALGAIGVEATSPIAHTALAGLMTATTVAMLWFDQRVTFRTLGLGVGTATATATAVTPVTMPVAVA